MLKVDITKMGKEVPTKEGRTKIQKQMITTRKEDSESKNNKKLNCMKKYYVNKNAQSNGDHEVHNEDCKFLPNSDNRKYLGEQSNCKEAVTEAKKSYSKSNGCKTCSDLCHTS